LFFFALRSRSFSLLTPKVMLGAQGDHPSLLVQRTSSAPSIFVEGTRRIEDKKEKEEASPHCIASVPYYSASTLFI
jgi:hypothetical protein